MDFADDFHIGDRLIRPSRAVIEQGSRSVHVKPKSMAVLVCLAAADGGVVTRNAIFDTVWPGCVVSDDVLTHCIVELRKAFADSARKPKFIETIPKIGFRLLAPVTAAKAESDSVKPPASATQRLSMLAIAVTLVAVFGALLLTRSGPNDASPTTVDSAALLPSVAVLPFVDMSADNDHGYFADGLTEELINRLTKIKGLLVTGRTSSFYFKGRNEDIRSIGKKLSVGHVLEGSIRRSEDRMRITAQLVDVSNGFHLWSQTYDRSASGIFDIQDEISNSVARALSIRLSVGEIGTLEGGTNNVDAFDQVSKGNSEYQNNDAEAVLKAIDHYQRAIELDPGFGLAWERLANVYRNAWLVFGRDEFKHWSQMADDAIAKSLEIAPSSPHVLTTAAYMHVDRQEWRQAMRLLGRIAELKSSQYVSATWVYADFLTKSGNAADAVVIKERSRIVDPLNAGESMYLAHQYAMLGRITDAFNELERGWALGSYRPSLSAEGVVISLSAGDDTVLRRWLVRAVQYSQPGGHGIEQAMLDSLGNRELALQILRDAFSTSTSTDYYVILWAAYYGDIELSLAAMRRSPDLWAIWLPVVAEVRRQPEFIPVVRATGLPEYWREFGWGAFCQPIDLVNFECR